MLNIFCRGCILALLFPTLDCTFWLPEAEAQCLPGAGCEAGGLGLLFREIRSSRCLGAYVTSLEQRPWGRFARPRHRCSELHCVPQTLNVGPHSWRDDESLSQRCASWWLSQTAATCCWEIEPWGPRSSQDLPNALFSWDRKAPVTKSKSMPVAPKSLLSLIQILRPI